MTTLSSLPPELLRDIIESTVPLTFHSRTYKERRSTLCSLSLVSRHFRAIAQPLFRAIVWIKWDEQIELLLNAWDNSTGIKELMVGWLASSEMVEKFVKKWKGFSSFAIERPSRDPFDLEVLLEHTALVNLQLSGPGFDFTVRSPLSTLRSLTFDWGVLNSSAPLLLDPEMLPSLQALALYAMTEEEDMQRLEATNISRLLPQLDAIVTNSDLYRLGVNDLFSGYASRILTDVWLDSLDSPDHTRFLASVQQLRIQEFTTFTPETSARLLTLLAASRDPANSSLKSIYLPLKWHPSRLQTAEIVIEMERVIKACEKAGIELVFDLQPEAYLDNFISEEFWGRQRRRRKEEEQR
ncbi:uncharacterized protein JCM6883_005942 [Sporobolomyces salmoneus]|uniref:uncharacterized protein n=1 Tax=Sporobolomyces salmoneus TaxID=183962 RepID=UPI003181B014